MAQALGFLGLAGDPALHQRGEKAIQPHEIHQDRHGPDPPFRPDGLGTRQNWTSFAL